MPLGRCHRSSTRSPSPLLSPQRCRRIVTPYLFGDYAHFQPGPGNSMGYDDLKVIEAKKFLVAVTGGERRNSTISGGVALGSPSRAKRLTCPG